jgi:hypothetical protein
MGRVWAQQCLSAMGSRSSTKNFPRILPNDASLSDNLAQPAVQIAQWPEDPADQPGIGDIGAEGETPGAQSASRPRESRRHHLSAAEDVGDGPEQGMHQQKMAAAGNIFGVDLVEIFPLRRPGEQRFLPP